MLSMLAWDHAKISENSCSSDKELTSSSKREFPKLTWFGMFGPIADAIVEAPRFWDHHARRGSPELSLLFGR